MSEDGIQILTLMRAIYHFYPVNSNVDRDGHQGFQQLREILKDKNEAAAKNLPKTWFELADHVKNEWHDCQVINLPGNPFPCYQIKIILNGKMKNVAEETSMLTVALSLLVKSYTLYICNIIKREENDERNFFSRIIVVDGNDASRDLSNRIEGLKHSISQHFPEYVYVDPKIVFTNRVENSYSYAGDSKILGRDVIYDYLFSHDMTGLEYSFKIF